MCCFVFWLVLFLSVLFFGMSGYLHTTTQRGKSRPCMVSSPNVTWISGVPHMFIFVRSLFPNVGWHDRMSYSDDCSKRVLGSDQRCSRKPTYHEACKPKKKPVPVTTSRPGFLSDLVMVACVWTGARSQTLRTFILICEAVLLAVPPMIIFVRSLFPNVGWHARVSYSDDYSKHVLGSDQHCCRKPTYYESCRREKNVFLLQPAAPVFSQVLSW